MHKATMVLEGGATRGVFTAGALDYLMEQDTYVSHVIGVSMGSCNAADYVSRQPGRTRDCCIPENRASGYIYGPRELMKERSLMNMDMIFDKYPNELHPFDYETYFNSGMKCDIVVTNCLTGKAEFLDERADRARLMKICRASCSMPLLTPIVNVDGVPYLDGGIADSVPIRRAEEIGNEKIVVILTRNKGDRKKPLSRGMERLYRHQYKSYPNFIRTAVTRSLYYNRTMNHIDRLEQEGRIFVLRPLVKPVSRIEQNKDTLLAFYDHGYHLMEREYGRLMEYLEE